MHELGVLTLTENVQSQFLQNDQIAFHPGRIVPGVELTDDKLLQSRVVSYKDAQRYRAGQNHLLLPVNKPRCPYVDRHVDGLMNFQPPNLQKHINYFPSYSKPSAQEYPADLYPRGDEMLSGYKVRQSIKADNISQATARYRSFDSDRKMRFANRIADRLARNGVTDTLRSYWFDLWTMVDEGLGNDVKRLTADFLRLRDYGPRVDHEAGQLPALDIPNGTDACLGDDAPTPSGVLH